MSMRGMEINPSKYMTVCHLIPIYQDGRMLGWKILARDISCQPSSECCLVISACVHCNWLGNNRWFAKPVAWLIKEVSVLLRGFWWGTYISRINPLSFQNDTPNSGDMGSGDMDPSSIHGGVITPPIPTESIDGSKVGSKCSGTDPQNQSELFI